MKPTLEQMVQAADRAYYMDGCIQRHFDNPARRDEYDNGLAAFIAEEIRRSYADGPEEAAMAIQRATEEIGRVSAALWALLSRPQPEFEVDDGVAT